MNFARTLFVTGGAGFIGSNYLNKFVPSYPDTLFVNIDKLTYAAHPDNILVSHKDNYVFEKADIADDALIESLFEKYKPHGVIHFAAESHVDLSISDPHLFIRTNVVGTENLLRHALKHKVQRFYQVSTDEVYGSLQDVESAFTETTPLAPNNPYSASKASADLLVRSYHKTFGLDTVTSRCSNNYGPNQDETKLIPLFIKKLLAGEKVPLYGKGENVRDWLNVLDHIDAIDLIFHRGKAGEVYNIGGNSELKNIEVVRKLIKLADRSEDETIEYVADRPGHDLRYAIDASKLERKFGWSPKIDFETGIAKTFEFYKKRFAQ